MRSLFQYIYAGSRGKESRIALRRGRYGLNIIMLKFWSGVRKLHKILIVIAVAVTAIVLLACLLSGPAAKGYIEKNGKELVGRRITIEKLRINPLLGRIRARGLTLYEADDTTPFVGFRSLDYRMSLAPLVSKKLKVGRIHFDSLYVGVIQNGESFNFDDIIRKFAPDGAENAKSAEKDNGWVIDLNDISVAGSYIVYKDSGVGSEFGLKDFTAGIPRICFSDRNTDAGITLNFDKGGSLTAGIAYNIDKSRYKLDLAVRNFRTDGVLPYIRQHLNVSRTSGYVTIETHIEGETQHIMDATIGGRVTARNIEVRDMKDETVFAADSVECGIDALNVYRNIAEIGYLRVSGPRTQYIVYKDSTDNFTALMAGGKKADEAGKPAEEASAQLPLRIKEFTLRNGSITYTDHTLSKEFEYPVSEIAVKCGDFALDKRNRIRANAVLGRAGKIALDWKGDFKDMKEMDLTVIVSNLDLCGFTPYSNHYVGNDIENGILQVVSRNTVRNNIINGENSIEIYKPELSKRVNGNPLYKLPVRLAVYLLTDRKGKLALDLPVSGDINDPKFSYRKIIWHALGNVVVKVAAAPFAAIGSVFSGSSHAADHIGFDAEMTDFNPQQYAEFGRLLEISKEKPELLYTLEQKFNLSESREKLSVLSLKRAYYLSRNAAAEDTAAGNPHRPNLYAGVNINSPEVRSFADSLLISKGLGTEGSVTEKASALFGVGSEERIISAAKLRNENLRRYFARMGAEEGRISILPVISDSLATYREKAQYKIGIRLHDSEE